MTWRATLSLKARGTCTALLDAAVEVDHHEGPAGRWPKTADLTTGHKEKRCALRKALLSKDPRKIIFTDESLFDCADTERCQWVVKRGTPEPRKTSESYVSMLSKVFTKLKMKGRWFMQDGAPAHSATNIKQYLKRKRIRELKWPPKSHDLNPIENLWGIVRRQMPMGHR